MVSMTKAQAAEQLGGVADELESLRASLEFPVGAHLPITPLVLERLAAARDRVREVGDAVGSAEPVTPELDPDLPPNLEPGEVEDPDAARGAAERGELVPLKEPAVPGADEVIPGVMVAQKDALVAAGFKTADDIRGASDEDLLKVPGIGPKTVADLREAVGTQGPHGGDSTKA